jgi:hypothetical protein
VERKKRADEEAALNAGEGWGDALESSPEPEQVKKDARKKMFNRHTKEASAQKKEFKKELALTEPGLWPAMQAQQLAAKQEMKDLHEGQVHALNLVTASSSGGRGGI